MPDFQLLLHKNFDHTLRDLSPNTQRKVTWAQVLLGTRGRTPNVKGTLGRNARWRRTPVQGNHYYMWWIPKSESPLAGVNGVQNGNLGLDSIHTILIHSVRHHDDTDRTLSIGDLDDYRSVHLKSLDPRFDEQAAIATRPDEPGASITTIKGLPGSGKTVALLYLLRDLVDEAGDGRILYVTYTTRLKHAAQEFVESHFAGTPDAGRVQIVTLNELLADLTGVRSYPEPFGELDEFYTFLELQNPADLGGWRRYPRTLFTEIRAHLLGRDFPAGYDWAEQNLGGDGIDPLAYAGERELPLDEAEIAYDLARRVGGMRFFRDQLAARRGLAELIDDQAPAWLNGLDALVVDEVQDLTLLQIAFLAELVRTRARNVRTAAPLRLVVAGDESQIVQPSGFDWGMTKYLLGEQLGTWPVEYNFERQRRSPANLAQLIDNSWHFYAHLAKPLRPSARRRRAAETPGEIDDSQGTVYLAPVPDAVSADQVQTIVELAEATGTNLPPASTGDPTKSNFNGWRF